VHSFPNLTERICSQLNNINCMSFTSLKLTATFVVSGIVVFSSITHSANAQTATLNKMPWESGFTGTITQTLHGTTSGFKLPAIDVGMDNGTPILAPQNSKVVFSCLAKGSSRHHTVLMETSDTKQRYSLIHVDATPGTLYIGRVFHRGERVGVVANDTPKDSGCAISYGRHLHFGLPTNDTLVDGVRLNAANVNTLFANRFKPSGRISSTNNPIIKNTNGKDFAGGKCLDVRGGSVYNDGIQTQIWDCNGTIAQEWKIVGDTIKNTAGRCLDIQGGNIFKDGTPVWLYQCNGTNAQKWNFNRSTGEIRNPVSNKCLDVRGGTIGNSGTPVQIWTCNRTNAQKWN
jgi:hypothetical protein